MIKTGKISCKRSTFPVLLHMIYGHLFELLICLTRRCRKALLMPTYKKAEKVPTGTAEKVPTGMAEKVPTGMAEKVPTGMAEKVPAGISADALPLLFRR